VTPERSRLLVLSGCAILAVALVGFVAGIALIVVGLQSGPDWMLYAGIVALGLALLIGVLGSVTNLVGFSHQLAARWRNR
jgi:hypothetical protein